MSIMLSRLAALLVLTVAARAGPRSSSLQFSVRSQVNATGQRIVTGDVQGAAQGTRAVGLSVDHWTTMCDGSEVIGFSFSVDVPSNNTVKPAFVDSLVTNVPRCINATLCVTGATVTTFPTNIGATPAGTDGPTTSALPPALSEYELLPGVGWYKDVKTEMAREQARLNCEAEGARLAVPESSQELDFFKEIYNRPGRGPWLGIKKTGEQWKTDEGNSVFIGWADKEPRGDGDCVKMLSDGLHDWSCEHKCRSICERRLQ